MDTLRAVAALFASFLVCTLHAQNIEWEEETPIPNGDLLSTSNPDTFTGADIAAIIGATTFYNAGYTGTGTIAMNVESGHIWSGHETLGHVTSFSNHSTAPGAPFVTPAYHRHATWVGMMIGGRGTEPYQRGIAYGTDLRSGAVATGWTGTAYSGSFSSTTQSIRAAYEAGFGVADVVNSSWGSAATAGSTQAAGTDSRALIVDGLANEHRFTTFVVSADNKGPGENKVSSPGAGYNGITVAALQNDGNAYNSLASFSSGGFVDYRDPVTGLVSAATARRVAVDIAAPGTDLTSAYYGGQTGGNDPSLSGSASSGGPDYYSAGLGGTSFAAPIVAGSVALMHQAAAAQIASVNGEDTRVIKANLLNAAAKITGWNNAQAAHPSVSGAIRTTQALDPYSGAGAMNLTRTYTQLLGGEKDLAGLTGGATSNTIGWDFGTVGRAGHNDVVINTPLVGGTEFRATLTWFRERDYDYGPDAANPLATAPTTADDIGYANLDLQIWDRSFTTLIAESISLYTEVEHLTFTLPVLDGYYGIRVLYGDNIFGTLDSEDYAVAWWGTPAPEPGSCLILGATGVLLLRRRSRLLQFST